MDRWLQRTGYGRGAVVTLEGVWALAQRWYAGRLSPEWRGRTEEEAQAILNEVGLTGEFWRIV